MPPDEAPTPHQSPVIARIRRIVVLVIGSSVAVIGILLLVLPGPGLVLVAAGLGILALEFAWAKRWLRQARALLESKSREADSGKNGSR